MRIVYENENGVASIVIPSPEFKGTMEELASKVVPQGVDYEIVNTSDIPTDRTFRNAWKHDKTTAPEKIAVDMVKAKDIAHERRRADRDELFKPLDVQATIPSQATQAETARQAIRDADAQKQIDIDNASTPDELKVIMETPIV